MHDLTAGLGHDEGPSGRHEPGVPRRSNFVVVCLSCALRLYKSRMRKGLSTYFASWSCRPPAGHCAFRSATFPASQIEFLKHARTSMNTIVMMRYVLTVVDIGDSKHLYGSRLYAFVELRAGMDWNY